MCKAKSKEIKSLQQRILEKKKSKIKILSWKEEEKLVVAQNMRGKGERK